MIRGKKGGSPKEGAKGQGKRRNMGRKTMQEKGFGTKGKKGWESEFAKNTQVHAKGGPPG